MELTKTLAKRFHDYKGDKRSGVVDIAYNKTLDLQVENTLITKEWSNLAALTLMV